MLDLHPGARSARTLVQKDALVYNPNSGDLPRTRQEWKGGNHGE